MSRKTESSGLWPDEAKAKTRDAPHEAEWPPRPLKTETHIKRLLTHCMDTCPNLQFSNLMNVYMANNDFNLVEVFFLSKPHSTGHKKRERDLSLLPFSGHKRGNDINHIKDNSLGFVSQFMACQKQRREYSVACIHEYLIMQLCAINFRWRKSYGLGS